MEIDERKQKSLLSSPNRIGVRPSIAPKPAKKLAKCDEIVCLLPKHPKEGEIYIVALLVLNKSLDFKIHNGSFYLCVLLCTYCC